ncbi:MAG: hypothetical protein ABIQ88_23240 [Chitinophagaceae bacterium]
MKFLCLWGTITCILIAFSANCQTAPLNQHPAEKEPLFNHLPEKISCTAVSLQNIFAAAVTNNISVLLGTQLKIDGTVIAKVAVTPDQLSINIRCSNYQNALLNLSRITQTDGSFSYIGRIVSPRHGDVLLLWEDKGQYAFIREKQLLTMVE